MSASIKLVSLNIERRRHLDLVEAMLVEQKPDVVCLQELAETDVSRFADILGAPAPLYKPMTRETELNGSVVIHGLGIFSHLPLTNTAIRYYAGDASRLPDSREDKSETFSIHNRFVLLGSVEKGDATFRLGTTHFTWSYDGQPTDLQRTDMKKLLALLEPEKELVLCGDFNAPRGGEIFAELATAYEDNVPAEHTSSIDGLLHRAGKLEKMVDGMFSTPEYAVSDFEMISGVSDHCALAATISKTV